MKRKGQLVMIHGGMTFKSRAGYLDFLRNRPIALEREPSWSAGWLDKKLGKDYDIIRPSMPLSENARYEDWKIHFERYVPLLRDGVVLAGRSLGGMFLAQYLAERPFPKKIRAVLLICPPFDGSLSREDLAGGFKLPKDLSLLAGSTKHLQLLFSADDETVPAAHAEKYRRKLPGAAITVYPSKHGHFRISTFPEFVKLLRDTEPGRALARGPKRG